MNVWKSITRQKSTNTARPEGGGYVLPVDDHTPIYRLQTGSVFSVEFAGAARGAGRGGAVSHRYLF